MKLMPTFLLVIIILALIFLNYHLIQRDFSFLTTEKEIPLSEYTERNVFKIEIQSKIPHIVMKRSENNNWKIIKPFLWPVNSFAVQKFFQNLRQNPNISSQNTIILSRKGSTKIIQNFHHTSTDPSSKNSLDEIIDLGVPFWCQQKIFPLNPDEIVLFEFIFHETGQKFSLSKKNSIWNFNQPIKIEADGPLIQKLIEWMANLEVLPLTDDEFQKILSPHKEKESFPFLRKPYITITLADNHQKKFSIVCGRFLKGKSVIHYAWIEGHSAIFSILWNDGLEHPFQSLCIQSLFLEIKSITFSYGEHKLFLSCNESGEWSILKFFHETQSLESLENFDVKSLLLFLSLMKPMDVVPQSTISDLISKDKLFLEIDGTLRFEAFIEKNIAYLLPMEKNYAIIIDTDLLQKLFKMVRDV